MFPNTCKENFSCYINSIREGALRQLHFAKQRFHPTTGETVMMTPVITVRPATDVQSCEGGCKCDDR